MKRTRAWLAVVRTHDGRLRVWDTSQFLTNFEVGLTSGTLSGSDEVEIHTKAPAGTWVVEKLPMRKFAKKHGKLRALYEPVWSHAMRGLSWGAISGAAIKLLDTGIAIASVNVGLFILFLVAIGVCFSRKIGMLGIVAIAFVSARAGIPNLPMMVFSSTLVGGLLGCLPGMGIGGIVGLLREGTSPRAKDAVPESRPVLKGVILPLACGSALLFVYFAIVNPWAFRLLASR